MTREFGCTFAVAPHFELAADWQHRLLIGTGVEECEGRFFPRGPWRSPDALELSNLVAGSVDSGMPDGRIELFNLPAHLRARWWQLLERAGGNAAPGQLPGFETFLAQVAQFLAFKNLAIDDPVSCDVVVSRPEQRSIRWDPAAGRALGLGCSVASETPCSVFKRQSTVRPRLWGAVNLGDEATSFVLINLPCHIMAEMLRHNFPENPPPVTLSALIEQFLRAHPDAPLVRVILHPGEGLRLPCDAVLVVDGFPQDKREPDVLLLITELGEIGTKRVAQSATRCQ